MSAARAPDSTIHRSMTASHLARNLARYQRIIVAAHIALAALFSVIVPPWEAHDETGHFAYVNHLVLQRALPNATVLFMAGMVNNDIIVSLMGATLACLLITVGVTAPVRARRHMIALGVVLGLSLLSKNSALIFVPFTAMALVYIARQQRWSWGQLLRNGLLVAIPLIILAAPWYASNYLNYGQILVNRDPSEPITQAPTGLIGKGLLVSIRDGWLPQMFVNAFRTFWGKFGWGNVQMPDFAYTVMLALCAAGLAGCAAGARHSSAQTRRGLLLMVGMGLAMLVLPGYRAIFYQNPDLLPGRYLMPALTAYAALLGFGIAHWCERIGAWIERRLSAPPDAATSRAADGLTLGLCMAAGL